MIPALAATLALVVLARPTPHRRARARVSGHRAGRRGRPVPPIPVPARMAAAVDRLRRGTAAVRAGRVDAALPPVLDTVAGALRSGASLAQAVAAGGGVARGPLAEDLAAVAAGVGAGVPLAAALARWRSTSPTPGVRLVTAALVLGGEIGGSDAASVEAVAASVRDRLAAGREARALSTTARLSAGLMAGIPVVFGLLLVVGDPAAAAFVLGTPAGLGCLAVGLALDAVGFAWMRRVTRSVP